MRLGLAHSLRRQLSRRMASAPFPRKVAVLGAAGGIGQPLSLLLKADARIAELALYDIANMGMAVDLGHIPTPARVSGHSGPEELRGALEGADIVIIPAGAARKPGMTRDALFGINAAIVRDLVGAVGRFCPAAHVLLITNPLNSTVPIAWETLRAAGATRPSVWGITTLDTIRAQTFIAEAAKIENPSNVCVSVVGGHSGPTIVPLLSTARDCTGGGSAPISLSPADAKRIVERVQYGGDEVVKAKAGGGSATLSMAHAGKLFFDCFLAALASDGRTGVVSFVRVPPEVCGRECSFGPAGYIATEVHVRSDGTPVSLAPLSPADDAEAALLRRALADLEADVRKGEAFAREKAASP